MHKILSTSAALLLTTTAASAGGLDRSGQGIGAIFETGGYAELSFGQIMPDVSGAVIGLPVGSGNVGPNYSQLGFAFKQDIDDKVSVALIVDQPFGADIAYANTDAGYPIAGSNAQITSRSMTLVGRYKLNDNVSIHFGPRMVTMEGDATVVSAAGTYSAVYASDTSYGYVLGAAYERPDIALRVALTYSAAIEMTHDTTLQVAPGVFAPVPETTYTLPQSVNLDFQTGVAADTLVFGSIRWAEWTTTEINSFAYPANPLVSYDNDVMTYTLGVGRRFSDALSASASVTYEKANGGIADNLAPTDGSTAIALGASYTLDNGIEIAGGVRYIMVGDATTSFAEFTDNSATAVGLKVSYNF